MRGHPTCSSIAGRDGVLSPVRTRPALRLLVHFVKLVAQLLLKLLRVVLELDMSLDDFKDAHSVAR